MKICDMHVHSCYSDGTFTPKQLVDHAIEVGLSAFALTDHNNLGGANEILEYAKGKDIEVVIGTEFSTDYDGTELHILGLFISPEHFDNVTAICDEVRKNKEESNKIMIRRLKDAGYDVDYDEIKKNCSGTMNRAHIGEALYKKGYTATVQEVFDTILSKKGRIYHSAKRLDAFETIGFINSIGAVSVLAHPFLDLTEDRLRKFLEKATKVGLQGMETVYTTYSEEQTVLAKQIAKEFNLKESGGSDFHGYRKPDVSLAIGRGNLIIPYSIYENLRPKKAKE